MMEEKEENKGTGEESEEKKDTEFEISDIRDMTPRNDEEAIERYIGKIPDVLVEKYRNYINIHKEDDELTKRYPEDFERSVRVLPVEKEGRRYLELISTDEKKTKDFYDFLKEGKFKIEEETIEGVDRDFTARAVFECFRKAEEDLKKREELKE